MENHKGETNRKEKGRGGVGGGGTWGKGTEIQNNQRAISKTEIVSCCKSLHINNYSKCKLNSPIKRQRVAG